MDFQFLKYEAANGLVRITLNRPEVYNALNDGITFEFQDALKLAAKDAAIRVIDITGVGKAFCSGQDLKAASTQEKRSFYESLHKRYNPIIRAMRSLPKPIVCRLNGVAAGAGCSLALACDIIVASEDAVMTEVFINRGDRKFLLATDGDLYVAICQAAIGLPGFLKQLPEFAMPEKPSSR